jgi:hypothetical protein
MLCYEGRYGRAMVIAGVMECKGMEQIACEIDNLIKTVQELNATMEQTR